MKNEAISPREWMAQGPFTLALSSTFFGFFSHCGIVTALEESRLKPNKATGSSAGGIIAAALGSKLMATEIADILFTIRKDHFWDPKPGPGLLKGKKFLDFISEKIVSDFEQTEIPVEIAAYNLLTHRTDFINQGPLPKAVVASCAFPLLFRPVRIGLNFYLDGGIKTKTGGNFNDPNERILCLYLESNNFAGLCEEKYRLKNPSPNHRFISYKSPQAVSYNSLDNGKLAFEDTYQRTKTALDMAFQNNIVSI